MREIHGGRTLRRRTSDSKPWDRWFVDCPPLAGFNLNPGWGSKLNCLRRRDEGYAKSVAMVMYSLLPVCYQQTELNVHLCQVCPDSALV